MASVLFSRNWRMSMATIQAGYWNNWSGSVQSISGAISTGTHGTGISLGTLSTQVAGLTLVTATGELLECSPQQEPDVFKAAQVSVGTLGVIAKVKLRVVPAKRLHYQGYRK